MLCWFPMYNNESVISIAIAPPSRASLPTINYESIQIIWLPSLEPVLCSVCVSLGKLTFAGQWL